MDHNLDLERTPETEKEVVFSYLNKTTIRYKEILGELIDAAYDIQSSNHFPDKYLQLFERAIRESYLVVFCHYSGKFLAKLSHSYKSAEDLFLKLSVDKKSTVRFNNVINVMHSPSDYVMDIVLAKGIKDSSSRVRAKTADAIGRLDNVKYAGLLSEQHKTETNQKVIEEIEYNLYWLANDYKVTKSDYQGYNLTIKTARGYSGMTINQQQFDDIENTVKTIRKDRDWNL